MRPAAQHIVFSVHVLGRGPEGTTEEIMPRIALHPRSASPQLLPRRLLHSTQSDFASCKSLHETTERYTSSMDAPSN